MLSRFQYCSRFVDMKGDTVMAILVEDTAKIRIAKAGPNKLFGDYDKRQSMKDPELTSIFDRRWNSDLQPAIESAQVCAAEEAKRRLADNQIKYFDPDQEHRTFRLQEMELVAQVQQAKGKSLLTQLWKVKSSDEYLKTLFVNFASEEEREGFRQIATSLGWNDEDLGIQLLRDFMNVVKRSVS